MFYSPTRYDWSSSVEIPEAHHEAHDYMMFLYSNIVGLLKYMRDGGVFGFGIEGLTEEQAEEMSSSEDPIALLEAWGKSEELTRSVIVGVTPALVSEFCSSMYEIMHLISRKKCSIAYQLLRKQLNETLMHIEWLAANPEDYVKHFNAGKPEQLQPMKIFKTPELRKAMIGNAISKIEDLPCAPPVMDPSLLYLLRYDRKAVRGYYKLTQQSIHLVTSKYAEVATEPCNLNFIFSDEESLISQQEHLYTTLPYICDYFRLLTLVVLDNVSTFSTDHPTWWIDEARRLAGLELLTPVSRPALEKGKLVSKILSVYARKCPKCAHAIENESEISRDVLHSFMYKGFMICPSCDDRYWVYPEG